MTTETQTPDLTEEERFALFVDEQDKDPTAATAKPDATQPTTEAPQKDEAAPPPEPFPGYSLLSEEGRKKVDEALADRVSLAEKAAQLEQRYKAQHGQLAPTQQKAADLERQNIALLNRLKEAEKAAAERANAGTAEAQAKFKELYPDEAAAMDAVLTPLQAKIAALEEQLGAVGQKAETVERNYREQQHLQKESAAVAKAHPDAAEVINDPAFAVWLNALPEHDPYRELVASKDARHAVLVLDRFKEQNDYAKLLAGQKADQKPAATPASRKPRLDVEPNPRNRQSPAPRGNAYGSADEEAWANFVDAEESRSKA